MTRFLKSECPHCGGKQEMYFEPWCSRCNMPSVKIRPTLNLMKVLRHVERMENLEDTGHRDALLGYLGEYNYIHNDSHVYIPFREMIEDNEDGWIDAKAHEMMKLIVKRFGPQCEDLSDVLWEVSW